MIMWKTIGFWNCLNWMVSLKKFCQHGLLFLKSTPTNFHILICCYIKTKTHYFPWSKFERILAEECFLIQFQVGLSTRPKLTLLFCYMLIKVFNFYLPSRYPSNVIALFSLWGSILSTLENIGSQPEILNFLI